MSEPALKLVQDPGDWDAVPDPRTAAAEAAAVPDGAESAPQGAAGRLRPGTPARAREIVLQLPPIGAALYAEATSSLRRSGRGAPWEEQPPSVIDLHNQVMRRSEIFAGLPIAKVIYIGIGHLCAIAAAACYWGGWAFFGSPGRLALSVTLLIVLRATGVLPHIEI